MLCFIRLNHPLAARQAITVPERSAAASTSPSANSSQTQMTTTSQLSTPSLSPIHTPHLQYQTVQSQPMSPSSNAGNVRMSRQSSRIRGGKQRLVNFEEIERQRLRVVDSIIRSPPIPPEKPLFQYGERFDQILACPEE